VFEINPNALYSRADLLEGLAALGINADAWLARVRPAKRFRVAWWGADLIEAIGKAPELGEGDAGELMDAAADRIKGGRQAARAKGWEGQRARLKNIAREMQS